MMTAHFTHEGVTYAVDFSADRGGSMELCALTFDDGCEEAQHGTEVPEPSPLFDVLYPLAQNAAASKLSDARDYFRV